MTFRCYEITEFYVFVTNSKGKMKNGSVYLSRNVCRTKDLNLKIVYEHQGRKPTTLEWWDECRLID